MQRLQLVLQISCRHSGLLQTLLGTFLQTLLGTFLQTLLCTFLQTLQSLSDTLQTLQTQSPADRARFTRCIHAVRRLAAALARVRIRP